MVTIGIIGYGSFGKLAEKTLSQFGRVIIYDANKSDDKHSTFDEVASADVVIISSGLSSLQSVCKKLSSLVRKDTLVVDVCAVKVPATKIMLDELSGKCQLLSLHPLFGPQTIKGQSLSGQSAVFIPLELQNETQVRQMFRDFIGLKLIDKTAEQHDKDMAWVHGLTFFVGRGLLEIEPPVTDLATGYYSKLLELVDMERGHSVELFREVETNNPYAAEVRAKLLAQLNKLEKELTK